MRTRFLSSLPPEEIMNPPITRSARLDRNEFRATYPGQRAVMIEVRGLTKSYRDHVAVEGLDFDVAKGEIVGFLGPNGAGKSTTMRILSGYMPATAGAVKIAGIDVFDDPLGVKRRVGYLPEIPPVYLDMTVDGYLHFVARVKGVKTSLRDEVDRVAKLAGVDHIIGRLIRNVSKGYRQRIGLAQALIKDPDVL